jgi:hypothetical protein
MFDTCLKANYDKYSGFVCILNNISDETMIFSGPPKLYHCPADVIRLNTSLNTNFAVIKDTAIGLQAYDIDGNKLHVE